MQFDIKELMLIIDHEVERLQGLCDYKEFLVLQRALEELSIKLYDKELV